MLIFDAHLDLSMNAMEWNRDLTLPVSSIRATEHGMTDLRGRELGTVSFPEMRKGEIGICVGTLIAPVRRIPSVDGTRQRQRGRKSMANSPTTEQWSRQVKSVSLRMRWH
jgi:hypothetical protein